MVFRIFKYLTFFCLIVFPIALSAQERKSEPSPKAKEYYNEARQYFYKKDYKKAILYCNRAKESDSVFTEPYMLAASIYNLKGQDDAERKEYVDLLKIDAEYLPAIVGLGTLEYNQGNFKNAQSYYNSALKNPVLKPPLKSIITDRQKNMKYSIMLMEHPVPFEPKNVGPAINTALYEYFPTLTVDGETMYFTRRKSTAQDVVKELQSSNLDYYNEDIMVSHKMNGEWQMAIDAPGLNTPQNEGAMCISPDGSFMILTACNRPDGLGSCDLYISFLKNNQWTKPVNMGEPVNSHYFETQPTISFDGRTIYFASARPGGFGGTDLYMSTHDDSWNFSEPVNMGPIINTSGDEQSPFIHPDDQTFYFCSKGHAGLGKNDIFYSRRNSKGIFDSVINIGYPINTYGDESGLVVDRLGEYAYYSSSGNKPNYGGLDIFYFKMPEKSKPNPVTYLKGKVFDSETKKPLIAMFELADLASGKSIIKSWTTGQGEFLVPVPEGKDYLVNVSKKGYLFYSDNIPLKGYHKLEPFLKDIPLPLIKTGQKITLKNIFYKTDAYSLLEESTAELDRLIIFLKSNPDVKIEVSGHTDNTGTPFHNKDLSLKRAQSVYNYLISKGKIAPAQVRYVGYGETQPIASNTTEDGKAQNRRTEVKVVE